MLFHLGSSPFEKKQCELSLVLLPSFFKLASVYVFSGERFNHLVWDRVHISGSHTGSLGRGGYGPNQMPRHVLMNLDTFLKTLSYLPSLKKVKLLWKKKKKSVYFWLHFAPGGSSETCSPLARWQQATKGAASWLLPTWGFRSPVACPWTSAPPDLSSRWPPYSYTGTIFSLWPICWVCVLIGLLFPIYMKDFLKKSIYVFIYLTCEVLVVARGDRCCGSVVVGHGCGPSCSVTCGVLVPWPWIEPASPPLQLDS